MVLDGFNDRQEGLVEDQHLVFSVIGDPGNLLRVQARIDRVQHRADPHRAIPGGHVTFGVPAQRGHPVAHADAAVQQRIGHLFGLVEEFGIGHADNIAFHTPGDDFPSGVDAVRVFENSVNRQRPVLHDTQHGMSPCNVFVFCNNRLI